MKLLLALGAVLEIASAALGRETIRVGYFPNLTHAQAIVGLEKGFFRSALGPGVSLETRVFNAGPAEVEALFAGEIDVGYLGPGPAIVGFVRSRGRAFRVVAGGASGGASFVVREDSEIRDIESLAGKKLASPQIGNTQDIALRVFLRRAGLATTDRGGSVMVIPLANPDILALFQKRQIDGAWVPEPWASRLRLEGKGRDLLDERELWPRGEFPSAVVVATVPFLRDHPNLLRAWLRGHLEATRWIGEHREEGLALVAEAIRKVLLRALPPGVLAQAWDRVSFTSDAMPEAFARITKDAASLGYLPSDDVEGIFELGPLREAQEEKGP